MPSSGMCHGLRAEAFDSMFDRNLCLQNWFYRPQYHNLSIKPIFKAFLEIILFAME
jgi:hypothetical protein